VFYHVSCRLVGSLRLLFILIFLFISSSFFLCSRYPTSPKSSSCFACCSCTEWRSFCNSCNYQTMTRTQLSFVKLTTSSIPECRLLFINTWSVWLLPFRLKSYLQMLRSRKVVLLAVVIFGVTRFTTLIPLQQLIFSSLVQKWSFNSEMKGDLKVSLTPTNFERVQNKI
jgi:hypothetical protein